MLAKINGLELSLTTYGRPTNLPLIFIHGFPFSSAMWDGQVQAFKNDFYVVTYDHRGHGRSEVGDGQYMLEFFVDDLAGVLDYLSLSKVILCGLSMGGYIALRTIERNPERILGLVLADTRSEPDSNEAKIKRVNSINKIKKDGIRPFTEEFLAAVFAPENMSTPLSAVDKIRLIINQNPVSGVCGTLIALASRTDTTQSLSRIAVPTLILVGEKDGITPVSAAESMRQRIAGSTLSIIPGAAHLSNMENPIIFNTHLSLFLNQFTSGNSPRL